MRINENIGLWLSRIGLGLILCYCVLASIFYYYFAQIHLTVHFLPFPVFVGEILLFICLVLLGWVSSVTKLLDRRSIILLGLYFGWILIKALINYCYDGPLTVRNAALFYYPIFAVFACCFYQKAKIPRKVLMLLAFLAAGILFFKVMVLSYWWTYITLFVIAVWNTKSVKLRWLGWIFLVTIFLLGKEYLYKGSRSHFVGVFGAVIFLIVYFGALLAKRREYIRLGILLISFIIFTTGFLFFSNRNAISSLTSLKGMIDTYNEFDILYQARQGGYVPEKLTIHLYNPKKFKTLTVPSTRVTSKTMKADSHEMRKNILNNILLSKIREGRSLGLEESNIVFRLFVWRDMARELIEQKAWWGFSFGKPQRSRSLEVLHWAESEWSRDGWIAPHNSFFHIIYRSGILGVGLICILFFMVGGLIKDFFNMKSVEGGFLVGALVYWLVLANFFLILEFPYNAIIFWTLFGVTWAYRRELKEKTIQ